MAEVLTLEELKALIQSMPEDEIVRVEFVKEEADVREETPPVQAP